MIREVNGKRPVPAPSARAAENASLAGDVTLGPGSSVWFGAVLRGDLGGVRVGAESNIQDNAVLHNARVGDGCTVGHAAVLDGCTVEDGCLIGMNATVLHNAVIGAGSLVAAGALVPEGMRVPSGSLVMGVPARVRGAVTPEQAAMIRTSAADYLRLSAEALPEA